MKRRIIQIDQEKCNGCGLCVDACHEAAIHLVNGKAKLLRDDYCDGLGDCLPSCPMSAITFVEKDTLPYDEAAVLKNMQRKQSGCPSSASIQLNPSVHKAQSSTGSTSMLQQWPVQMQLVSAQAPFFHQVSLLIAADCTAFAYGNMHQDFMKDKVVLIGCPKLDVVNYTQKLTEILKRNHIIDIHVVRMEVPCCGGLVQAVHTARQQSGAHIPYRITTITRDGRAFEEVK